MSYYKRSYRISQKAGKKNDIFKKYKDVLTGSFIFNISNPLGLLLSMTDSDFEKKNLRLPYANVFLDCKLEWNDWSVFGITLSQLQLKEEDKAAIYLSYLFYKEDDIKQVKITLKRFDELDNKNIEFYEVNQKIKLLVLNFLDFLNNPGFEFVEHRKNKQQMGTYEKKFSKGCLDIVLKGKLKEYCDYIGALGRGRYNLRNSFWVRGHWRRFEDIKYVNMKGKKAWIYPYIKGVGLENLKRKNYDIKII